MRTQPGIASSLRPTTSRPGPRCATWDCQGPVYYRLGKDDRDRVPGLDGRFDPGRVELVRDGRDMLMITVGAVALEAVAAAERLAQAGIQAAVAVVACLSPAPEAHLSELLSRWGMAATVEAHHPNGGLGSLVSEIVAEGGIRCRVLRCGISRPVDGTTGSEGFLNARYGLDGAGLADRVAAFARQARP